MRSLKEQLDKAKEEVKYLEARLRDIELENYSMRIGMEAMRIDVPYDWNREDKWDATDDYLCETMYDKEKCTDHPDAPHGYDRQSSHTAGRYVCECESWEPEVEYDDDPFLDGPVAKTFVTLNARDLEEIFKWFSDGHTTLCELVEIVQSRLRRYNS